ncbi:Acetyltransferase (GNAT) family [Carpediemonas membranifera]|uniref:N-alpha-acetyltransferase 40 n=1 Tax=Carpediemonas membranifera TaxID=201153 RepID=A0A8J6E3I2_9EUKA|nr:Acetyltransferase (GNAT) family [Carpediemonas membranifera]|eukprot:KAG9393217.1 Acetyltransferase (GNAT) family [Carpediemonas membranifera]
MKTKEPDVFAEMRSPDSVFLFVPAKDSPAIPADLTDIQAFCHLQLDVEDGLWLYIWEIHAFRPGNGQGSAIMRVLKSAARTLELDGLGLTVFSENTRAVEFYKGQGFRGRKDDGKTMSMAWDTES